jgi:hypothetical protein
MAQRHIPYRTDVLAKKNPAVLGFPRSPRVEQIFSVARVHTRYEAPKPIPSNPKSLARPQKSEAIERVEPACDLRLRRVIQLCFHIAGRRAL